MEENDDTKHCYLTQSHMLLPEVWSVIGLHLPPQHIYKLLSTCKQIRNAVDNDEYWTQVAAHLLWRDCECMELFPGEFDVLSPLQEDLYNIPSLAHAVGSDYKRLMHSFMMRMEEMRLIYSEGAQKLEDEHNSVCLFGNNLFEPAWWKRVFEMPLQHRNVCYFELYALQYNLNDCGMLKPGDDAKSMTQKELARRKTLSAMSVGDATDEAWRAFTESVSSALVSTRAA